MAYGIVHTFPGGTKDQYEASLAAVHPKDGSLPPGNKPRTSAFVPPTGCPMPLGFRCRWKMKPVSRREI